MLIQYSDDKLNTKTRIEFNCDNCGKDDSRNMISHSNLKLNNPDFNIDYCRSCWNSIRQTTPTARKKMSIAINKMMTEDPDWKVRNSKSKKGIINLGDTNGMKHEYAKNKVSSTRKKMMTPEFRDNISKYTAKAWADGKYDEVKVGQSKWFDYEHSNGTIYKVQGTWELVFIKWMDDENITFDCHRGRIPYTLNGKDKSYYPDFFVHEWNQYVDIKNSYHYNLQIEKFKALSEQGNEIRIILKEELESLTKIKL